MPKLGSLVCLLKEEGKRGSRKERKTDPEFPGEKKGAAAGKEGRKRKKNHIPESLGRKGKKIRTSHGRAWNGLWTKRAIFSHPPLENWAEIDNVKLIEQPDRQTASSFNWKERWEIGEKKRNDSNMKSDRASTASRPLDRTIYEKIFTRLCKFKSSSGSGHCFYLRRILHG